MSLAIAGGLEPADLKRPFYPKQFYDSDLDLKKKKRKKTESPEQKEYILFRKTTEK